MVDCPGVEIGFGVSAVYGTATPPKVARCLCTVVGSGVIGGGDWRHGEEDTSLGKGGAKRAQAGGDADQVEEISVLTGGAVGPLAGNARRREADEERAAPGAANVAGGPVPALFAAVGEVSPADFLGAIAKSSGESGGGAHGTGLTIKKRLGRGTGIGSIWDLSRGCRGRSVAASLRLSTVPGRRPVREARAAPCGRLRLGPDYRKKGPAPCRLSARERPC